MWGLKSVLRGLVAAAVVVLSACGGGGSDAGSSLFGGGTTGNAAVADLRLGLSAATVTNTGGNTITATATAVDSSNNTLSGVVVKFAVDSSAAITPSGTSTDSNGVIDATVSPGSDRSNRVVTVTASSEDGKIVRTATFAVVGANIVATAVPAIVAPGSTGNLISYTVQDAAKNPMAGVTLSITSPALSTVTATTDVNGRYDYTYTAPSGSGAFVVTASAAGASTDTSIQVQAGGTGTIPVVTTQVASASVAANPSVVSVNSTDVSTITASFSAANNASIQNVRVRFDLNGDPNSVGGTIGTGTTLVYSNANGIATTTYRPGSQSSPKDGVQVRACWDYSDFAVGTCPNQQVTTLTVASDPLSVNIGTNGTIGIGAEGLTYIKQYVVQVVDSAGQPKADVLITPSVDLLAYRKGFYTVVGSAWVQTLTLTDTMTWNGSAWSQTVPAAGAVAECPNEDVNRNGKLDAGENYNGADSDGVIRLQPAKSDVSITVIGNGKTNSAGKAVLQIEYPQNVATWDRFRILVTGAVSGTEGRAVWTGILPAPAEVLANTSATPAFVDSPYGTSTTCTDTK